MTDQTTPPWTERVRQAITPIAEEPWTAALAAHAQQLAARELVSVTLFGPYDAGKSTLLKRLLVENGTPVPGWLTVSGRRETFEARMIESGGLCYVDTPGIGADGGDEQAAEDALTGTDVLMLVLLPKLLTDRKQKDRVLSIVTGEFFNPGTPLPLPHGALLTVVAQADLIGPSPYDAPEEFAGAVARVRRDLDLLFAPAPDTDVHIVVADLEGMVGADPAPEPVDYEGTGEWDGMDGLRTALARLPARHDELRAATLVRFWSTAAAHVLRAARHERDRAEEARAESERDTGHLTSLERELDALDAAARAELRTAVREELGQLTQAAPTTTGDALRTAVRRRLTGTFDAWSARWGREVTLITTRAGAHADAARTRPGAQVLHDYLDDVLSLAAAPAPKPDGGVSPLNVLGMMHLFDSIGEAVRGGSRRSFDRLHGRAADAARTEIAEFTDARATAGTPAAMPPPGDTAPGGVPGAGGGTGGSGEATDTTATDTTATDTTAADTTALPPDQGQVSAPSGGEGVADGMLESGLEGGAALLIGYLAERRAGKEQKRLSKLRADLDRTADDITVAAAAEWQDRTVAPARTALRALRPPDTLTTAQQKRLGELATAIGALEDLLREPPA
ncbi:GTPase domain-containing protein [Streptomyces sp. NPDC005805]|uniref:GTPase domain-containing protein n=1 Tax=Streptomyces sp. NPDC005805 TaxID=3157068 RepID=UPI00340DF471